MRPGFAPHDFADETRRSPTFVRYVDLAPTTRLFSSDPSDQFGGVFGTTVSFPSRQIFRIGPSWMLITTDQVARIYSRGMCISSQLPSLVNHVLMIGGGRPEPQVPSSLILDPTNDVDTDLVIADTGRVVAGVADELPLDRPVASGEPPRHNRHFSISPLTAVRRNTHDWIAPQVVAACSIPAGWGLMNARPKPISQRKPRILAYPSPSWCRVGCPGCMRGATQRAIGIWASRGTPDIIATEYAGRKNGTLGWHRGLQSFGVELSAVLPAREPSCIHYTPWGAP